jgi:hypothetical protein
MGIFDWAERGMKKMRWYDMSVLKVCVLAFALLIAKIWPVVLMLDTWFYAVVAVASAAYVLWIMR